MIKINQNSGEGTKISRIINVIPNDNYTLLIELEHGNKIVFNMKKQTKIIPYAKLSDIDFFKTVKFDGKSIYWEGKDEKQSIIPLRFSLDSILFSIRD